MQNKDLPCNIAKGQIFFHIIFLPVFKVFDRLLTVKTVRENPTSYSVLLSAYLFNLNLRILNKVCCSVLVKTKVKDL